MIQTEHNICYHGQRYLETSTGTYFEKNVSNWNWIYTKSSYR